MDDGGTTHAAEHDVASRTQTASPGTGRRVLAWLLVGGVVLNALATAAVSSLPGSMFLAQLPIALVWLLLGALWIVLLILDIRARRPSPATLVVPVLVVVTAAFAVSDSALQMRFDLARPAFQDAVDSMPADDDYVLHPGLVGTYAITSMERVPGGVILYDWAGNSFVDDAGFAYLPDGPTPELENGSFENPQWHDLGGGWWSWTASW